MGLWPWNSYSVDEIKYLGSILSFLIHGLNTWDSQLLYMTTSGLIHMCMDTWACTCCFKLSPFFSFSPDFFFSFVQVCCMGLESRIRNTSPSPIAIRTIRE